MDGHGHRIGCANQDERGHPLRLFRSLNLNLNLEFPSGITWDSPALERHDSILALRASGRTSDDLGSLFSPSTDGSDGLTEGSACVWRIFPFPFHDRDRDPIRALFPVPVRVRVGDGRPC